MTVAAPDPYAELRQRLVKFFGWRNADTPEDLAQETLARGLTRLREGLEPDNRDGYFFAIAWNVLHEAQRAGRRQHVAVDESTLAGPGAFAAIDVRLSAERVMAWLEESDRQLLMRYHAGEADALRRDLGVSAGALRVRVHRLHNRLSLALRAVEAHQ